MRPLLKVLLLTVGWLLLMPSLYAKDLQVDVAPFGRSLDDKDSVGVEWPEMRRISVVEITFADDGSPLPPADSMKFQYWHRVWNGAAIRRYGEQNAGTTGWAADDDWFNGDLKTADSRSRVEGRRAIFTFVPSNEKEFPELKTPGVTYRPTLKIRLSFSGVHPRVQSLKTRTDSILQAAEPFRIQFENRSTCDDPLEVYNGWLGTASKQTKAENGNCVLSAAVAYARNSEDPEADRTIVTVRSPSNPFSFAMDEIVRGDRIFVKDFGVLVTRAADPVTITEHRRALQEIGEKSVYDRVQDHPEQTLSGAWNDMPIKRPYYLILGLEGGRQRFELDATGDLWVNHPNFSTKRPGKDNGHFLWPDGMSYHFGLPASHFADRTIADGYLPIDITRWVEGDVVYEQEGFADLLTGNLNSSPPMQADDPTVAILKFRFVNTSPDSYQAHLALSTSAREGHDGENKPFETLRVDGDRVSGNYQGSSVLRFLIDTRGAGRLENLSGGVTYEVELPGHAEHTLFVKVPFITLTEAGDIDRLRALNPEREREEVGRFWRGRVATGSQIRTPEPWLNDFYKAHLIHLLINDEREVGADRYMARVGSFFYGAFGNESIMMISDLDRRGYWKEAERSLDLFLHYQGTVRLPGNFTTQKGILYGAGGYEMGDYNQHHGWILWGLAEHYWHTRNRAWMERAASHMVDACRWITDERKGTMKLDPQGRRVPEYGLLPAGSLEDVTDFWYWLSTNAFTWWGLSNAAAALEDYGHPEGSALVKEAESYRQDILRAYREAAVRAPVVRLRDGTYVPDFPSNPYTRGRAHGWLRETLEGAIMLPIARLMDPTSREAEWILKDYEDNRYISDKFGYSIPVFDRFWFSRGGFSMQPNLLHGPLAYFYRDQIEHFLRAYFDPFASAYDPTLRMLCEHPLPELGYFVGDHYKTSDEAQSAYWLRLMFVAELDGALHLGRGLPRYWLRDGETIGIKDASTYFGKTTYEIRSKGKEGKIEMSLDPPSRNAPREIVVRFRHPESKPIRRVTVNGKGWQDFDAIKGDIRLRGTTTGHTEIVAEY
ncbi:MAG: hypothetical protein LAO07_03270 [Acidobacteriia bacterium]|nr:hypothetical protein [Terriglobia bacterium]